MAYSDTYTIFLSAQALPRKRSLDTLATDDILSLLELPKVKARMWRKVKIQGPDDCWLWIGARWQEWYGKVYLPGPVPFGAHRASWILANKSNQPNDRFVCHTCDVKLCVNPLHLYLGTPKDNSQDAVERNLIAHGSRQGCSKLTERDIPVIRRLHHDGNSIQEIAKQFGISHAAIWLILNGKNWRRVSDE